MVKSLIIDPFDIYSSLDDRIELKNKLKVLFAVNDEMFFYFRREEDLTSDEELTLLRRDIFNELKSKGKIKYLQQIDERRFDCIATIKLGINFTNLILDMMKYCYACVFFRPINGLTFEEFEDYLIVHGSNDINGVNAIHNMLAEFICVKGLGADHLIISYTQQEEELIPFSYDDRK